MGLGPLLAALPDDFNMTLVDVGSAGGLHSRWRPFRSILSAVLFDPREAASSGCFGPGETRVYPVALSDRSGSAELNITALANMSSFLRPNAEVFDRYIKKGPHARVVRTESVPVERLDVLARVDGFEPHVLKVDTQGSELMVLNGAEESLRSVLLAEVEVSFFQRYEEQPVFADIEAWMKARGFELIELYRLKRYRAANSMGLRRPLLGGDYRSGRVAYGDAIFLRNEQSILELAAGGNGYQLLRAALSVLAYGKSDHAGALLDRGGHLLDSKRVEAVRAALGALARRSPLQLIGHLFGRSRA